ncbi:MAG: hypothetical protein AAB316_10665, partial [Bacteroidota bacterium]
KPRSAQTEKERERLLEQLKKELKSFPHFRIEPRSWSYHSKDVLEFEIQLGAKLVADVDLILSFDKAGCLWLGSWRNRQMAQVSAVAEIEAYAEALRKASIPEDRRMEKLELEAVKREKVKSLKQKAIFAKIKSLCEDEKVDYLIEQGYRNKIKLFVRLSRAERMEVDIYFGSYQNILQNLQSAIQSLRELMKKGVFLKVKSSVYVNQDLNWIEADVEY